MPTILIIFLIQVVFVLAVIFVLKRLLDRELMNSALEKFESCKSSDQIKEITVFSCSTVNKEFRYRFESVSKRRFPQAQLKYRIEAGLKGGVVLCVGEDLLDFSLRCRLQNFWT